MFPGFEAAFHIPLNEAPSISIEISPDSLNRSLLLDDKHQRVYNVVELYSNRIIDAIREEESRVDVWCVIIPDEVKKYCRPQSYIDPNIRIKTKKRMSASYAKSLQVAPSLFPEENKNAVPYYYDVNFHNQLKARLLEHDAPTQIIRESTIAPNDFTDTYGKPVRNLDPMLSDIAWHLSTAMFYKASGRPWKIGDMRKGVCYIGLVYKRDEWKRQVSRKNVTGIPIGNKDHSTQKALHLRQRKSSVLS